MPVQTYFVAFFPLLMVRDVDTVEDTALEDSYSTCSNKVSTFCTSRDLCLTLALPFLMKMLRDLCPTVWLRVILYA